MILKELIASAAYDDWSYALAASGAPELPLDTDVVWSVEGENDGPEWQAVFRTAPTTFLAIRAWCDYTGWDCQSGGAFKTFGTVEDARVWLEAHT